MSSTPARLTPHAPAAALPAHWQGLLEALIEAACLVDGRTQRIIAANQAAATLWGRPLDTLVGGDVIDLAATPEDLLFWSQAAAEGGGLHSDTLIHRDDGSALEVERRVSPIQLDTGRPGWLVTLVDQSGRRQVEDELSRLAGELGATLDTSHEAILITDLSGAVRTYNRAFAQLWRLPDLPPRLCDSDQVRAAVRSTMPDALDYEQALERRLCSLRDSAHGCVSDRLQLRDRRVLERRLLPQYGRGQVVGWVQVWSDLTAELENQARLALASRVFDSSLDAILVADAEHRIVAANPAAERLCGGSARVLRSLRLDQLLTTDGEPVAPWLRLAERQQWEGPLTLDTPRGPVPLLASLVAHVAPAELGDERPGCIAVLRDVSERQAWRHQLQELRLTDTLTGLPNRRRLETLLRLALPDIDIDTAADGAADPKRPGMALLHVGLDRFKHINDTLGHRNGDRVLVEAAARLQQGLRTGDTVARLEGDQFVVLLPRCDAQTAELIARRLLQQLAADWVLDELRLSIGASIGVALFPGDGRQSQDLLLHAEQAMRRVKQRRGGDVRFYQPQMNIDRLARMKLDHAMRRALPQGRFSLHYQPQLDLRSGALVGAEALCRWHDTELGMVSPGHFIPVAEETGFIAELGDWVLREAVAQAVRWQAQGLRLPVSVNVSVLQFQQPGFVQRVAEVLAHAGLEARWLELELTESILADDLTQVQGQLQALAELGVTLSIDDFGTGYASLSYVRHLSIHRLKIDRSFIQHLPGDAGDAAIARTIVDLALALGLRVIAEGVETEAQHAHLAGIGCHDFQGFLCSPAVPAAQFEALARGRLAAPADPGTRRIA
ncbi:diguanylate cyclase/phosphodiesterase with PAS/PAC sensor(s) [Sphaerotilus hippei]|uniref:Diguanylate cyclase/phosphodiesterase with PAS/PAC sensor(S) n=1 Tax=Sphaerotilus hippei TaxID=744406 RepID=A0A318H413_9BURK|nr:bifunctional diguanylate cyclase/phosphodiesterase [Sphaerotilus hippei]PXW98542.1 diguanylate cyclase/phosphodiesterase with PAS/PAC sensor(s) [Sphaerotilus hippei]